jgi:hypothetical protein
MPPLIAQTTSLRSEEAAGIVQPCPFPLRQCPNDFRHLPNLFSTLALELAIFVATPSSYFSRPIRIAIILTLYYLPLVNFRAFFVPLTSLSVVFEASDHRLGHRPPVAAVAMLP